MTNPYYQQPQNFQTQTYQTQTYQAPQSSYSYMPQTQQQNGSPQDTPATPNPSIDIRNLSVSVNKVP